MEVRIVLADDHKLMREGLRTLIAEQPAMTVVAEAEDGEAAAELARKLSPHIVIMDISMPGLNGIDATRRIVEAGPGIRVIALSMHLDKRMVLEMLNAGAAGYLLKDCAFDEVIAAIGRVSAGEGYISCRVADVVVKEYALRLHRNELALPEGLDRKEQLIAQLLIEGRDVKQIAAELHIPMKAAEAQCQTVVLRHLAPRLNSLLNNRGERPKVALTLREKEILTWVREGKNNGEIASILEITTDTVKFHLRNIFQKLNVTNRSQAISVAIEQKLIEL